MEETAAPGSGFTLFGTAHIIWMAAIVLFVLLMCFIYYHLNERPQVNMLRVTAGIIFISELVRQTSFVILIPVYPISQLPLHLCGLSIFIELIHAIKPNRTTGEILYSLVLPGATAGLLFANWTMYPLLSYQSIQSFAAHGLHVSFVIMPLCCGV
ncbi:MAG: YwaF family protein, partial [Clostridiales bacterium]|nr:YwaF family protein [Clostridiales bacterium]